MTTSGVISQIEELGKETKYEYNVISFYRDLVKYTKGILPEYTVTIPQQEFRNLILRVVNQAKELERLKANNNAMRMMLSYFMGDNELTK